MTNRSHSSFVLDELGQRVDGACALLERVSREKQSEEFDREIERQEHEIRTGAVLSERTRKKRGGEARQLPEVSMWPQRPFPALLCNLSEQCEEVS